jgi:tRNA(adenine34) deaminase
MNEKYMKIAIENALQAASEGEVPVGCVIVHNNEIIASTYNKKHQTKSALAHAEIEAIKLASSELGTWILDECTMYVTLEPCPMCAGAIVQSRLKTLVFGALEPKSGYVESLHNTLSDQRLNHQVEIISGVLRDECSHILKQFFKELRNKKKNKETF